MPNANHRKLRRPLSENLRKVLLDLTTTNGQAQTAAQIGIHKSTLAALTAGFNVTGAIVDSIERQLKESLARTAVEAEINSSSPTSQTKGGES